MSELIHRGSVKDIYRYDEKSLLFKFSNRFSVFDWGQMPDEIEEKGQALASFSKSLYCKLESPLFWKEHLSHSGPMAEKLKKEGLRTHQLNLDCGNDEIIVKEVACPRGELEFYKTSPADAFIPLEVIFRLGVVSGSSLLARDPAKYTAGQIFDEAMVEFSTKWEARDRMLSNDEAQELAFLSHSEMSELVELTQCLAQALKSFFGSRDISLWDGKVEWAFYAHEGKRSFILVDSIGPDELRLTYQDLALSKEFLRSWYRKTDWYKDLLNAKEKFGDTFHKHCTQPEVLPQQLRHDISQMYKTLASLIDNKPNLGELVTKLERWL